MWEAPPIRRLLPALSLVTLLALAGAGCSTKPAQRDAPPSSPADGKAVVGFGNVDLECRIPALAPTRPGRVTAVEVEEGQEVAEGQVLLRLDDQTARARVDEAAAVLERSRKQLAVARLLREKRRLQLEQQEAVVAAAEQRLAAAKFTRDHQQKLYQSNLASEKVYQVAEAQVKEAEATLRAERQKVKELQLPDTELEEARAEADVLTMQARLKQAEQDLDECVLKAPEKGVVLRVLVAAGDLVSGLPNSPALQFLPAKAPLVVRLEVSQEFADVAPGDKALVEDYYDAGGFRATGRVKRVAGWYTRRRNDDNDPSQFKDVRVLECIIDRLQPDKPHQARHLRIGQRMKATVIKAATPAAAATQRP